jgi:hypothetical protein
MKLENILSNNNKWKIKGDTIYVRYMAWIPFIKVYDDHYDVYFDTKLHRYILQILPILDKDFYLISPIFSNPKYSRFEESEKHKTNILNMLSNYTNPVFFHGFKKIGFDIIESLVKYCKKYNCLHLIKEPFDQVNDEINKMDWNYYTNVKFHEYPEEIREEFKGLLRQIKLAELLS